MSKELIKLGSGNFSITYLDQERQLVIKELKPKFNQREDVINLFKREAEFNFDYDGLPRKVIYRYESQRHFIVKPYVEGINIKAFFSSIKRKQKIEFTQSILLQLIDILSHLENQSVVHCDIKPENILIDPNKQVHLIDFGMAQKQNDYPKTKTLFSLGFSAPELILNRRDLVNSKTDQYSLGILIYYLIMNRLPFHHENPSILTNLNITFPVQKEAQINKNLMGIIQKLCAKHSFSIPPNQMEEKQLIKGLIEGMNLRFKDFIQLSKEIDSLQAKKFVKRRFYI